MRIKQKPHRVSCKHNAIEDFKNNHLFCGWFLKNEILFAGFAV